MTSVAGDPIQRAHLWARSEGGVGPFGQRLLTEASPNRVPVQGKGRVSLIGWRAQARSRGGATLLGRGRRTGRGRECLGTALLAELGLMASNPRPTRNPGVGAGTAGLCLFQDGGHEERTSIKTQGGTSGGGRGLPILHCTVPSPRSAPDHLGARRPTTILGRSAGPHPGAASGRRGGVLRRAHDVPH